MPVFIVPPRIISKRVQANPLVAIPVAREVLTRLSDEVRDLLATEASWVVPNLTNCGNINLKRLMDTLRRVELVQLEVARGSAVKAEAYETTVVALDPQLRCALEKPLNINHPDHAHRNQVIAGLKELQRCYKQYLSMMKPSSSNRTKTQPAKAS